MLFWDYLFFPILLCPAAVWWSTHRAASSGSGRGPDGAEREGGRLWPVVRGLLLGATLSAALTAFAEFAARPLWTRYHDHRQVMVMVRALEQGEAVIDRRFAASMLRSYALNGIGREAIPALVGALEDPDGGVRSTCCSALRILRATEAIPALRKLSEDEDQDERVRGAAAYALGELIKVRTGGE